MNVIAETVVDDWEDIGLGKVEDGANVVMTTCIFVIVQAWFKVIEWESAAKFRAAIGLTPKDFHITVGYRDQDIHHVRKDKSTVVQVLFIQNSNVTFQDLSSQMDGLKIK